MVVVCLHVCIVYGCRWRRCVFFNSELAKEKQKFALPQTGGGKRRVGRNCTLTKHRMTAWLLLCIPQISNSVTNRYWTSFLKCGCGWHFEAKRRRRQNEWITLIYIDIDIDSSNAWIGCVLRAVPLFRWLHLIGFVRPKLLERIGFHVKSTAHATLIALNEMKYQAPTSPWWAPVVWDGRCPHYNIIPWYHFDKRFTTKTVYEQLVASKVWAIISSLPVIICRAYNSVHNVANLCYLV